MRVNDWLKLIFSVGVFASMLALGHPQRIWGAIASANMGWLALALALWACIQGLNVLRWWILSRAQGLAIGYARLLRIYFVGMFFNMFLPSGFGGDVIRGYELSRQVRGGGAIVSVAADRFIALYALILLGCGTLCFAPTGLQLIPAWVAVIVLVAATATPWALVAAIPRVGRLKFITNRSRWLQIWHQASESTVALQAAPRAVAVSILVALVCQAIGILMHYLLILALGLVVPLRYLAVFFPILSLAASLPISVNGIGVREGGFLFFLGRIGVAPSGAVALGVLSFAMLLLSSACGAILYAVDRGAAVSALEGS